MNIGTIHPTDWTPEQFIQHEANLSFYERRLSGMAKMGQEVSNPIEYKATQTIVIAHRTRREAYFEHHAIKAEV